VRICLAWTPQRTDQLGRLPNTRATVLWLGHCLCSTTTGIPEQAVLPTSLAAHQFPRFAGLSASAWAYEFVAPGTAKHETHLPAQDGIHPRHAGEAAIPDAARIIVVAGMWTVIGWLNTGGN
jgi:hypothetical protein